MTAEATIPATDASAVQKRSFGTLVAISIFWLALNLHWGAIQGLIISDQIVGLLLREAPGATISAQAAWVNDHKSLTLGLVLAPGLVVALMANPLFGLLSDRTPGRFGRRRPYILIGTLLNIIGLAVMALGPLAFIQGGTANPLPPSILVLMGGLMLTQLANNAAAAPFHALLPDIVPSPQRGTASGVMGIAQILGTIGGVVLPLLFGFHHEQLLAGTQSFAAYYGGLVLAYAAVAAIILVLSVLTVITVHEMPVAKAELDRAHAEEGHMLRDLALTVLAVLAVTAGFTLLTRANVGIALTDGSLGIVQIVAVVVASIGAAQAFAFRPRRNPDFTWVVVTRMLVMMGIYFVYTQLNFYMGDVVVPGGNAEAAYTSFLVIMMLTAMVSTILAGWLSDRFGRKRMVYISGGFMAAVGAAFVISPHVVSSGLLTLILGAAAIFGLGYGAYLAVDWALVADVLPSEATFARDMGIWNIALTLPQVMAAVLGGWLITLGLALGSKGTGYDFLFIAFVIFCLLGTVTVRFIKGVKK